MHLIEEIVEGQTRLTQLRRDIHQQPELAFEETRAADIVAAELKSYELDVVRGLGKTGVVGTLQDGSRGNRAIGFRANMDALAVNKLNTFEHASARAEKCMDAATTDIPSCCSAPRGI